jgi:hypothetical protein
MLDINYFHLYMACGLYAVVTYGYKLNGENFIKIIEGFLNGVDLL